MMNTNLTRQIILYSVLTLVTSAIVQADPGTLSLPSEWLYDPNFYDYLYDPHPPKEDPEEEEEDWNIPKEWNWHTTRLPLSMIEFTDETPAPTKKWKWETEWYNPDSDDMVLSIIFDAPDSGDPNFPREGELTLKKNGQIRFPLTVDESEENPKYEEGKYRYIMSVDKNPDGLAFRHDCSFCEERPEPGIGLFQDQEEPLPPEWEEGPIDTNLPHIRVIVQAIPIPWQPDPPDDAIEVDTGTLSWRAGRRAVLYIVYLSEDETIDDTEKIAETDMTFVPVDLIPGVTYYWRVDAEDVEGVIYEGDVWSFTTIPLEAHFPIPADGATDVVTPVTLRWMPGKVAVMHDLYLNTDEAAVAARDMSTFKGKLISPEYDPGPLELETAYYWAVDEFTPTSTVAGPVWSFTTMKPPADVTVPGDIVRGIPNDGVTTGGGDNGWPGNEHPALAIDDNVSTKYLHFKGDMQPTGLRITPLDGPSIVTGLTLTTANDVPGRDPIAFELSGSNEGIDGPYELIAAGDIVDFAGPDAWPRFMKNTTPIAFDNSTAYTHYQLIFTAIRGPVGGSVNSMQIAEVELLGTITKPALVKINFQQAGGDIPSGYLPDYGDVFGDRGNGFSYGWNIDSTGGAFNRNNAAAPNEQYDTLNHIEKGEHRIWEIELPNGTYDIFLACGDPSYTDQINNIDIEGTVLSDPDGEDNYDEYSVTVEVVDGLLTIQMAEGASNAKVMFVEIY